jgi:hypothetical protein
MLWWNFKNECWDNRTDAPKTDVEALQYIPIGVRRNLYQCHRQLGLSVLEAMVKALQPVEDAPGQ